MCGRDLFIWFVNKYFFLDCGRVLPGVTKGQLIKRLFITSGTGEKLAGTCVYFLRIRVDVALTIKNIYDVSCIFCILSKYNQTCDQQPPKGHDKTGCLRQVAADHKFYDLVGFVQVLSVHIILHVICLYKLVFKHCYEDL